MEVSWSIFRKLSHPATAFAKFPTADEGKPVVATQPSLPLPLYASSPSTLSSPSPFSSSSPLSSPQSPNSQKSNCPKHPIKWRVDGCTTGGTRFFAIPISISPLRPLRIDIFIPEQVSHPADLRAALQSNKAFHIGDQRVAELGISQAIVGALEHWADSWPDHDFARMYAGLPFGSRIKIANIAPTPTDMEVCLEPGDDVEKQFLTMPSLQTLWQLPPSKIPPLINLDELNFQRQLQMDVTLVTMAKHSAEKLFIFKSATIAFEFLYHELKVLLTLSPHPNIMGRPLSIVTKRRVQDGEFIVCGFILEYHTGGNLRDIIPLRARNGTLDLSTQLKWAQQLVSALIFVFHDQRSFYSDVRADNIVLACDDGDGLSRESERIVLIDFAQDGNQMNCSAPEIYFLEFLAQLLDSKDVPTAEKAKYESLLLANKVPATAPSDEYTNAKDGHHEHWVSLSPPDREAAVVYSLGKTLWCIFEGMGTHDTQNTQSFRFEPTLQFPQFVQTPPDLRPLIRRCILGPDILATARHGIKRVGETIYPRGMTGSNGEPVGTAFDTAVMAQKMWRERLEVMEVFLEKRAQWVAGKRDEKLMSELGFPMRPGLRDILIAVQEVQARLNIPVMTKSSNRCAYPLML
jgi:hypothetical protein